MLQVYQFTKDGLTLQGTCLPLQQYSTAFEQHVKNISEEENKIKHAQILFDYILNELPLDKIAVITNEKDPLLDLLYRYCEHFIEYKNYLNAEHLEKLYQLFNSLNPDNISYLYRDGPHGVNDSRGGFGGLLKVLIEKKIQPFDFNEYKKMQAIRDKYESFLYDRNNVDNALSRIDRLIGGPTLRSTCRALIKKQSVTFFQNNIESTFPHSENPAKSFSCKLGS